jgi:hypothetical protein
MTLQEYKETVSEYLAKQNPPVALADDDDIWIVVRVAHGQRRGPIWMAALALAMHHSKPPTHELLQHN